MHRSVNQKKTLFPLAAVSLSAALLYSGLYGGTAVRAEAAAAPAAVSSPSAADYKAFLQNQYKIELPTAPTKGEFIQDVAKVLKLGGASDGENRFTDLKPEDSAYAAAQALADKGVLSGGTLQAAAPLTEDAAVYIALKAADLEELAYTYPEAKIKSALRKLGIDYPGNPKLSLQAAQELAAAVDTGLLPAAWHGSFGLGDAASDDLAADLLGSVLSFKGAYKHAIGSVADADIFAKLYQAYQTQDLIQVKELQAVVDEALKQNLITGYNLKDSRYSADFNPKRSLTYGHDDITHAVQLIGLLRSEGLNAKVQLEPKTSAFVYLKEWGEPKQTDSYKVVQIENGNYIAYAKEYDLAFEFDTAEQKAKFQDVIFQYAKKNSEDAKGLIAGSWWQPLYYSLTPIDAYKEIANNKLAEGHYYAQTFSLSDKTAEIASGLQKIRPGAKVESYRFWVDEPFYNYLLGGYK
ncbi:hypothetical protein [Paenibacillus ehimensis]|uniref:SLH domain-containing protein n=1 Tax=Paenibacillus ehimensis TaxID=79264 RepID=A0ABT8VFV7_9BACL|nr:hypothetical protein [Paenibacillus ehimensis]MDO3679862.1 hypothetical protein [Paenibacillus ehimensis]MEC0213404.1 hypothetical protein [Paenibacillus ehimensis]